MKYVGKHVGDLIVTAGDTRDFSGITEVTGYVRAHGGSKLDLPACTSVGGYVWTKGGSISLPACTIVGGYVWADNGAKLDLPACTSIKGESFPLGSLRMVEAGQWTAILTPKYLSIACQRHTWDEWIAMSDDEIAALDDRAAEVATKFRAAILAAKGE